MLDRIKAGEARQKLIGKLGIGMKTLERIVAKEEKIRELAATTTDTSRKRKRTGKHEHIDSALESWFESVRKQKQTVTGQLLMEKSKDFAKHLDSEFSPSIGWLGRWKKRMGIKVKRGH